MSTAHAPATAERAARSGPVRPGRRRLASVAVAVAAAWLLPLSTHRLGLDFVLVPAILLGAAALVRGGRTLLDQLVVAATLLFGAVTVAGLATTWWPWGLNPVPLAGGALSALVLLSVATGRRPLLQARGRAADVVALGAMLAVAALVLRQFVQRDAVGRLALLAPGEDLARHFILYDAIGKIGGYAFLHPGAVADLTPAEHAHYPQALHLLFAGLLRFWRSTSGDIAGPASMDWFVWCCVATFIGFAVAVLWAARRLAGPRLTTGRSVVVLGAAAAYLFFGDPITIMLRGFPNELAGLGFVAILVAIGARPLRDPVEQILVVAALLVAIAFTYYLFLPAAAVAAGSWLVAGRRRLRHRPVALAVGGVLACAAAIPVLTNPTANRGAQLLLPGTAIPVDRQVLLALYLVLAAGLAVRSGLRPHAWQVWAATALAAVAVAVGIVGYQLAETGRSTSYYGEKAYHLVVVLGITGLGAVANLLPSFSPGPGRLPRIRALLPAGALVLAVLTMFGAVNGPPSSSEGGSYGMGLLRGREGVRRDGPAVAYLASQRFPGGAGMITVDLSHGAWANFYGTLYGLAMQRTYVQGVQWYAFLYPDGEPKTMDDLERQVLMTGEPVRFVVGDPAARFLVVHRDAPHPSPAGAAASDTGEAGAPTNVEAARELARRYPGRVEVVTLGG